MSSSTVLDRSIFACTDQGQEVQLDENAFPQVKGTNAFRGFIRTVEGVNSLRIEHVTTDEKGGGTSKFLTEKIPPAVLNFFREKFSDIVHSL